jgi:shikimate kinase
VKNSVVKKNEDLHQSSEAPQDRIFLIGFMGTGKTHWGRIWASRHVYSFIDLDEAIEAKELHSVSHIFEKKGEDYFRQKEAVMLRTMSQHSNTIIACGGGTPCFFDNMDWMNDNGTTIFLKSSSSFILKNILSQNGKRPLVKKLNEAELLFYIEKKLKERNSFYEMANITLGAENLTDASIDPIILQS